MSPLRSQTAIPDQSTVLPLVSVVIPCYNGATFVSEAIDSVLTQSFTNIEIIVVNDGSTDDTAQVLNRYRDVVTTLNQPNGGLASARNTGLRAARGEFVALFDADDVCQPERLSAQVAAMMQLPDVVLCSSDFSAYSGNEILDASHGSAYYRVIGTTAGGLETLYPNRHTLDTTKVPWPDAVPATAIELLSGDIYERLVWGNFVHPPTIMARRTAIAATGEFDEGIANGTDYDWIMRICRLGPAAYVNRSLLKYRYSEAQLSSPRNSAQLARDTILAMDKLKERDPALFQRHWSRFQRRIGTCHLHAADALIETCKPIAAMELLHSLGHGIVTPTTLKVVVKLMLPRAVLAWRRRRRPVLADELHGRSAS